MIDHVLGRPSSRFRKVQVLLATAFWTAYLLLGNSHGPPILRRLSTWFQRRGLTPWHTLVMTLLYLYIARNTAKIFGLESPEPLANLYSRSYFRATWITTAMDAGFWSAMRIKNKKLKDFASIIFTIYYLIAAEQADEKVRKVRSVLTVDHMRVAWNKGTTPYLRTATALMRPKFMKTGFGPRRIMIPRPRGSAYSEEVVGWMYFDGSLKELEKHTNIVLDVPGGGFVAMSPRESEDKLLCWAGRTGIPILSLDYRKAPEWPYPYALNECFDVYRQIMLTKGACIGLRTTTCPRITLTGDSAGGNLATATTLMILEHNNSVPDMRAAIPVPAGLVLIYPALDMNIGSWMSEDQMALIKNPRTKNKKEYENFMKRKSEDIDRRYTPTTPRPHSEISSPEHDFFAPRPPTRSTTAETDLEAAHLSPSSLQKPIHQRLSTRLAVSSIISYFGDRILTPEMMRAMVILYVGPHARPDFRTDYLLCPVVAPESLLERFPKTYFLTGERDPLVDDTVVFAGRLRAAKLRLFQERRDLSLEKAQAQFDEREHVEVSLIPGISHGFVQFVSIFPEGWRHIDKCAKWIRETFDAPLGDMEGQRLDERVKRGSISLTKTNVDRDRDRHHRRIGTGGTNVSEADEDPPLSMTVPVTVNGHANGTTREFRPRSPELERRGRRKRGRRRSRSLGSLGSEEDLLKRRMAGLTFSLLGSDV